MPIHLLDPKLTLRSVGGRFWADGSAMQMVRASKIIMNHPLSAINILTKYHVSLACRRQHILV